MARLLSGTRPVRRRRLRTRALPVALLASGAFLAGALVGGGPGGVGPAQRFVEAWESGDFAAMHAELSAESKRRVSVADLATAYREAASTATITAVGAGEVREAPGREAAAEVPLTLRTEAFGTLERRLGIPLASAGVEWGPHLTFPGLRPGERLAHRRELPQRAPILAVDGSALAAGPADRRSHPAGPEATHVTGSVGATDDPGLLESRLARGFPTVEPAGITGLELAFDDLLAGRPGGELLAVRNRGPERESRLLARAEPVPGEPLSTTIDPSIQRAAVEALGGLYGGVAVLDARNGAVRALAGIAFSAPQPPGSTFKIVTTVAALEAGIVEPEDTFPVETSRIVAGRKIENADDAYCGGTFAYSFAHSCNTVFAPLGVEVGGERLVRTAERFGFNSPPSVYGPVALELAEPPQSSIPAELEDDLEVAVSAIGQGEVLATPLQMASVAQTIAARGRRVPASLIRDRKLAPDSGAQRVTSRAVAASVTDLMRAVVDDGTGTAAAIPGVDVAGKTGTAELGPDLHAAPEPPQGEGEPEPPQRLDAWFAAFAPAERPELAIAVMIAEAEGGGGAIAAPIAREVLESALTAP